MDEVSIGFLSADRKKRKEKKRDLYVVSEPSICCSLQAYDMLVFF